MDHELVWCLDCWTWHPRRYRESADPKLVPVYVKRRRIIYWLLRRVAFPILDAPGKLNTVVQNRLCQWAFLDDDADPPVEPPPGFTDRGRDWATYPESTP